MKTYQLFIEGVFKCTITAHIEADTDIDDLLEEAGYQFGAVHFLHHPKPSDNSSPERWDFDSAETGKTVA